MGILTDIQKIGEPTRSPENVLRRSAKAGEEVGELLEAALSVTSGSNAKRKEWIHIIEEAVDVAVMGIDIALTKPPGFEEVPDEQWKMVVKAIFAMKLKKWQTQLRYGGTLIRPAGESPSEHEVERLDPVTDLDQIKQYLQGLFEGQDKEE